MLFNVMIDKVKKILNLIIEGKLEYSDLDIETRTPVEWKTEYKRYKITVDGVVILLSSRGNNCWLAVDSNCIDISKSEYQILQKLFDCIKSLDAVKKDDQTIDKLNSIIDACN